MLASRTPQAERAPRSPEPNPCEPRIVRRDPTPQFGGQWHRRRLFPGEFTAVTAIEKVDHEAQH